MSTSNNGGSAFPCLPPQDTAAGSAVGYPHPEAGMSLRDYFAAKALVGVMGMVATRTHDTQRFDGSTPEDSMARDAYRLADAMLKVRQS